MIERNAHFGSVLLPVAIMLSAAETEGSTQYTPSATAAHPVHTWLTQFGVVEPHCVLVQQLPVEQAPAAPAVGEQQTSAALPVHVPASALVHATVFVSQPPVVLLQM